MPAMPLPEMPVPVNGREEGVDVVVADVEVETEVDERVEDVEVVDERVAEEGAEEEEVVVVEEEEPPCAGEAGWSVPGMPGASRHVGCPSSELKQTRPTGQQ